jgi:hypothetical protein
VTPGQQTKGTRKMPTNKTTAKAPANAEETAPKTCRCGCGQTVTKQFKPGHDARYAGLMRTAVAEGKMTREDALAKAAEISPAFLKKVTRSLDLVAELAAKAAETKTDDKAA